MSARVTHLQPVFAPMCLTDLDLVGGALLYNDINVTMTSTQLNGSQRVLLDDVISEDECRELHRLSNVSNTEE